MSNQSIFSRQEAMDMVKGKTTVFHDANIQKKRASNARYFRKKSLHELFNRPVTIVSGLVMLASLFSCYLSYPYLVKLMRGVIPHPTACIAFSLFLLVLNEASKHFTLYWGILAFSIYKKRLLSLLIFTTLIASCGASVFFCLNGIGTAQNAQYEPPKADTIKTHYESRIVALKAKNESIFKRNKWKGRLDAASLAGQAYGKNENLIFDLETKRLSTIDSLHQQYLNKYKENHNGELRAERYLGLFNESFIMIFGFLCLWFKLVDGRQYVDEILTSYPTEDDNNDDEDDDVSFEHVEHEQVVTSSPPRQANDLPPSGWSEQMQNFEGQNIASANTMSADDAQAEIIQLHSTFKTLRSQMEHITERDNQQEATQIHEKMVKTCRKIKQLKLSINATSHPITPMHTTRGKVLSMYNKRHIRLVGKTLVI